MFELLHADWMYNISDFVGWLFWNVLGIYLFYLFIFVPIDRAIGLPGVFHDMVRFLLRLPFRIVGLLFVVIRGTGGFLRGVFFTGVWLASFCNNFRREVGSAMRGTRLPFQTLQQAQELRDTLRRGEWRRRVRTPRR